MPKYLGKVELGGFYLDNLPLLFPTKPWRPDSPIIDRYNVYGDIPSFKNAPNISRWTFGNTPTDKAKRLTWVKIGLDNGKSILICDRVILYSSRSDLGEYITGKNVSIDGMTYRLRALTGGANYKNGPTTGGERPNEWDSYICNEANLAGIPTPLPSELSRYQLKVDDLSTESNKFWNHVGIGTLCQELYKNDTNNTIVRGGTTPLYHYNVAVSTTAGTGFRPVLEVDNDPPTISGVDENLGVKSSTFDIPYTIDDFNSTDTLTVTEKLDDTVIRSISPAVRNQPYSVRIDLKNISPGPHKLAIEVVDNKNAKAVRTYDFTIVSFNSLKFKNKLPLLFEKRPSKIWLKIVPTLPEGTKLDISICNNALDTNPTLEKLSSLPRGQLSYEFSNKVKTSSSWGVNVEVDILRGSYSGKILVEGFAFYVEEDAS